MVGDLAELVPPDDPPPGRAVTERPDAVSDSVLLEESVEALSGLLDRLQTEIAGAGQAGSSRRQLEAELNRTRGELAGLQTRHDALQAHDDRLVHDMRHRPIHHLVIGVSESRPWVMKARVAYRRTANRLRRVLRRSTRPDAPPATRAPG